MIKGNKGEWSEFYAFIKLLAEGQIYAADKNLNKNEDIFYKVLKIIRGNTEDLEYIRNEKIIIQNSEGEILSELSVEEVSDISKKFYEGISKGKTGERAFNLEFAEETLEKFYTDSLSDERVQTADIRVVIHDPITQYEPLLGFSIKSYIGSKPTLFNASKNSNIIFKIEPALDQETVEYVNSLSSYGPRVKYLNDNGYSFKFYRMNSDVFKTNLELIDSKLPEILADLVLTSYVKNTTKLSELITELTVSNPCSFNLDLNPDFYSYKIKRLLIDAALGMKAGKVWSGTFNANGGYIIVKKDGDLVCYHIYNWNDFQEYLLNHTKIDFPDSSPHRCDYGIVLNPDVINEDSGSYIKLNFQIRFT